MARVSWAMRPRIDCFSAMGVVPFSFSFPPTASGRPRRAPSSAVVGLGVRFPRIRSARPDGDCRIAQGESESERIGADWGALGPVGGASVEDIVQAAHDQAAQNEEADVDEGKNAEEGKRKVEIFFKMMNGKEISEEEKKELEDAQILEYFAEMPARIKCATLSWHSADVLLNEKK